MSFIFLLGRVVPIPIRTSKLLVLHARTDPQHHLVRYRVGFEYTSSRERFFQEYYTQACMYSPIFYFHIFAFNNIFENKKAIALAGNR